MAAFRTELTLSPEEIAAQATYVLEGDTGPLGFYRLTGSRPRGHLEDLFVEPAHIGRGCGKMLWEHALATARELGFESIDIASDPFAEAFYLSRGAKRVGQQSSPVNSGRFLPVMRYELR